MTARTFGRTDGVSTIIGAILIAGILIAALVTVQVSFVPVWQKDRERSRMVEIEAQLAGFRADLERQVDNRSSTALTHPLAVGDRASGFFGGPALSDTIHLVDRNQSFVTRSQLLLILQSQGTSFAGLNPTWVAMSGSATIDDVLGVLALRVRLHDIGGPNPAEGWANLTVRDAQNDYVGSMNITSEAVPSGFVIRVTVRDGVNNIVTEAPHAHFQQEFYEFYYIDALEDLYLFDQLIASGEAPLTLELRHPAGFDADYNIAYTEVGPGGLPVLVGSSGILRPNYVATYNGLEFSYRIRTSRMPPATYVFEHGALVMDQNEGAAFKVQPSFTVDRASDITALAFNVPILVGDPFARSGTSNAVILTSASSHQDLLANAPEFEITLQTRYPSLWMGFWNETLGAAGLSAASGHFVVTQTGPNTVFLGVYGSISDQASSAFDMSISFKQALISVSANS